jgi:hypothetical protein
LTISSLAAEQIWDRLGTGIKSTLGNPSPGLGATAIVRFSLDKGLGLIDWISILAGNHMYSQGLAYHILAWLVELKEINNSDPLVIGFGNLLTGLGDLAGSSDDWAEATGDTAGSIAQLGTAVSQTWNSPGGQGILAGISFGMIVFVLVAGYVVFKVLK